MKAANGILLLNSTNKLHTFTRGAKGHVQSKFRATEGRRGCEKKTRRSKKKEMLKLPTVATGRWKKLTSQAHLHG